MISTILVPTSGSQTDEAVFATALTLARACTAHLEFYHLRLSVYEAAVRAPHVQFCRGGAMTDALKYLSVQSQQLSMAAKQHFDAFCSANQISARAAPALTGCISAHWSEESDEPELRLMHRARHNDLVVLGRPHHSNLLRTDLIPSLLIKSGRPIVIAPDSPRPSLEGTVVLGWRECGESAHALAAALPLLVRARKVIVLAVANDATEAVPALDGIMHYLAWHGIAAEKCVADARRHSTAIQLLQSCAQLTADLLVVGGFCHAPAREGIFGGVTRTLIEQASIPVFMAH